MTIATEAGSTLRARHHPQEYERVRRQAECGSAPPSGCWTGSTRRRGRAAWTPAADPGVTMRQLAQRVGPQGRVVGIDVDAALGRATASRGCTRDGPPAVRVPRPRPARRRADPWRSVRPRLRATAALPPPGARRRARQALGRRGAGRPPGRAGLRPRGGGVGARAADRRPARRLHPAVPSRRPAARSAPGPCCPGCSSQAGVGLPDGDRRRRPAGPARRRRADAGGGAPQPAAGRDRPRHRDRGRGRGAPRPAARRRRRPTRSARSCGRCCSAPGSARP